MKIEISGLREFQRDLENAQRALSSLDGTLATVTFSSNDPSSVESAIRAMEQAIDAKVAPYARNPIVAPLVEAAKDHYRQELLELFRNANSQ